MFSVGPFFKPKPKLRLLGKLFRTATQLSGGLNIVIKCGICLLICCEVATEENKVSQKNISYRLLNEGIKCRLGVKITQLRHIAQLVGISDLCPSVC